MTIVDEVIKHYGGVRAVQKRFGYTHTMAVYQWRRRGIPTSKLIDVHLDTGIDLRRLQRSKGKAPRTSQEAAGKKRKAP